MNIYWGDIHNHCGITYGFGSLENAISAARNHLDFCSVTGHAMWPDMYEGIAELKFAMDYHKKGFKKLADNWDKVRKTIMEANTPGEFITFQGYEMHSRKYGDYHIVSPDDQLPLVEARSPADLIAKISPVQAIAILHHSGYTPGYRGGNWQEFNPEISPVAEVYSKHGCGISDRSPYPYLHDMGPRDSRGTIYTGLEQGYRFGFVASTDHHAGYPGSYGDGRLAVLAEEKTRKDIFSAILNRRTYAVTGDKIICHFSINGFPMGSVVTKAQNREIDIAVKACDEIDKIVVFKNLTPWKIINGEMLPDRRTKYEKYKIRIEMGWGYSPERYDWNGQVRVEDGVINAVETCFRGKSILAPKPGMEDDMSINKLDNRIIEKTPSQLIWKCSTFKNQTTLHPQTNAIILDIQGNPDTRLDIQVNGKKLLMTLHELISGSRSMHMKEYVSEAVLVHRAIPESRYCIHETYMDHRVESDHDFYHVEIRQMNGQCAWISPIWFCDPDKKATYWKGKS